MKLFYCAQDRLDLAETTKHLVQRTNEPREFDFVPLERAARYLDKTIVFVDSNFAGDPAWRESKTVLVAQIGDHTVKSGSTLQILTALSVGEAEFSRSGERRSSWSILEIYVPRSGNSNEDRNTK